LTWTFSARAGLGRSYPVRSRPLRPVSAAGRLASAALLRSLLRGARPRPLPPTRRPLRRRRARPRWAGPSTGADRPSHEHGRSTRALATEIVRWAEAIGAAHVLAGADPTAPTARR